LNKILIISVLAVVLLSISVASISAQSKYDIPAWVKGVAGFWSEGKISNDEFGDGLSFLIDNDIIKVPKIKELQDENTKLKNDIVKLQSENTKLQSGNTQPTQNPTMTDADRCSALPKPNIDLHGCNLIGADLTGANLSGADLRGVDLTGANLSGADFTNANLSGANLNGAGFNGGVVENAKNANFSGANLSGITYVGCIGTPFGTPSVGTLPICMPAP
jgi:uncharacterized protein YjbI with pentapeptide repeats